MTHEHQRAFKGPPKKYQPRGLAILYEDRDLLVVDKASGLLTVGTDTIKEQTAYYLLTDYVRKGNQKSKNRIFIVHRLDRDTSGLLVFAKTEEAKRYLQDEWQSFKKQYCAVKQRNDDDLAAAKITLDGAGQRPDAPGDLRVGDQHALDLPAPT